MNKDLISIVVPVYNVENYLKKCLDSIINQTYKNIEIIVIDDGSSDGSGKICDEYAKKDNRIKVFHKKNEGLSEARNLGITKAKGKYICFLDSDDDILTDYVEFMYKLLLKYNTKMVILPYNFFYKNKIKNCGNGYSECCFSSKECLKRLLCEEGFTVSANAKLYDISLFNDTRYPYGKLCEDNGTTYKLIMKCDNIVYSPIPKYNYYLRENSIMNSQFNMKKLDLIELTDNMCDDIINKYPDLINSVHKRKNNARFSILRQMTGTKLNSKLKKERSNIIKYLKQNRKQILNNPESSKKDKLAIIILFFGIHAFNIVNRIYKKIR